MLRRHTLIAVVVGLFLVAVGLRLKSQWQRAGQQPVTTQPTSAGPVQIPEPHDYVVKPWVAPDEVDHGPRRIISMAPSITEIVCALGMRDRLVGRTRYCFHPPGLELVETVGVMAEIDYGRLRALKPDLILTTRNSGDTLANLHKLGLRCEAVPHETLDEVYAAIVRIGDLCDRPKTAAALVGAIRADIERLQKQVAAMAIQPRRVLVVFGELPVPPKAVFVAGPGLFLDTLVRMAGHHNAAEGVLKSSQGEIPLEMLRVINPDVILEFRQKPGEVSMDDLYRTWSEVGRIDAIVERRVRPVGGYEWLSAGPRIAIELHRFITVLSEWR